jgi:hypothetical protein
MKDPINTPEPVEAELHTEAELKQVEDAEWDKWLSLADSLILAQKNRLN